jgi:hypothetical protein
VAQERGGKKRDEWEMKREPGRRNSNLVTPSSGQEWAGGRRPGTHI